MKKILDKAKMLMLITLTFIIGFFIQNDNVKNVNADTSPRVPIDPAPNGYIDPTPGDAPCPDPAPCPPSPSPE